MGFVTALGLVAGFLTATSFVPQILKTWKTKSVEDISYGMFAIIAVGAVLWLLYGLYLAALPIILTNATIVIFSVIILSFKLLYQARE